jgi:hypothetical protein
MVSKAGRLEKEKAVGTGTDHMPVLFVEPLPNKLAFFQVQSAQLLRTDPVRTSKVPGKMRFNTGNPQPLTLA